jgi:hypothetical protein
MFDVELTSPILCVLECTTITSIEFYLGNRNGCFAMEKSSAPHMVPQATHGNGCAVFKETPITVTPHPFTAYKYRCLPRFSSQHLSSPFFFNSSSLNLTTMGIKNGVRRSRIYSAASSSSNEASTPPPSSPPPSSSLASLPEGSSQEMPFAMDAHGATSEGFMTVSLVSDDEVEVWDALDTL